MKWLIVSDIHGDLDSLNAIINRHLDIQSIICAGDIGLDIKTIEDKQLIAVKGNADFYLNLPKRRIIDLDGQKVLITHGDLEGVKYGLTTLKKLAIQNKVNICIYGHTHEPHVEESNNILFINPGAINSFTHNYAIYQDGKVTIYDFK